MITAKNYAAQAEKGINTFLIPMLKDKKATNSIMMAEIISAAINTAVHFVVPDTGAILGDALKGLYGVEANLPYEIITIEYYTPFNSDLLGKDSVHVSKRVILAIQGTRLSFMGLDPTDIVVISINYFMDCWWIQPIGGVIKQQWQTQIVGDDMNMTYVKILPEMLEGADISGAGADVGTDMGNVLALLEALSCRNVSTANHQDASPANAKRIKAGKLPFYETKMLVIDSQGSSSGKSGNGGGSHASPRQHLRRGHIRRLSSGNIWVNSCVVGDSTKGQISKSYAVV